MFRGGWGGKKKVTYCTKSVCQSASPATALTHLGMGGAGGGARKLIITRCVNKESSVKDACDRATGVSRKTQQNVVFTR